MKEMDIEFLRAWFQGFEAGLEGMDEEARRGVLAGCARQCARSCPLKAYKEIWAGSQGDLHRFFRGLGQVEGISVQEAEPGVSWRVIYPACGCDLVTGGLVRSPAICQCSRLSLAYCLEETIKEHRFQVIREKSILSGDSLCGFLVIRTGGACQ